MKLNKRQTKIIAASFFLVILIISTSFIVIKNVSKREEKKQVPIQPNTNGDIPNENENGKENNHENDPTNPPPLPNNNLEVEDYRKELINNVEKLLKSKNIEDESLLQKLKDSNINGLNPSETDWRNYFNSVTNKAQLVISWTIVSNLINNLPNGQNLPPSTPPSSPPTNKWEKNLREIKRFLDTNPQTLQEVKDWVKRKSLDPLAGINLAGIGIEKLKKMSDYGPVPGLNGVPETVEYEDCVQLPAAGDGNCFLHSFSVFLVGRSDVDLTLRLRVALCLELMTNPERYFHSTTDEKKIVSIKDEISREGITENRRWLNSDIIKYLAYALKRPIVSIIKSKFYKFQVYDYPNSQTGEGSDFIPVYPEKWVVYNSGGHYQPLIKK